jgi:hypothetical protein
LNTLNPLDHANFTDTAYRKRILSDPEADELELSFVESQAEDAALAIYTKYKKEPAFLGKIAVSLARKAAKNL